MSDSIHHKLHIVAETAYGVTPATPTLQTLRHTACSLALSKDSFRSAEINATRNLQDYRHGNRQIGGDIGVEISAGTYDVILESLLMGAWTANVLKIGQTRKSFSTLREFVDQTTAGQKKFHLFTGVELNKLALSMVAGRIVSGTFGVIGRDVSFSDDEPVDSVFDPVTTTLPMDTFTGSMTIGGVAYDVTELTVNIENGLTPNFVLFSDKTSLPSTQLCSLSGEIGVRFNSAVLLEAFAAGTKLALAFTISDGTKSYAFSIPKIMLNGGQPDVGGEGPINLKIPFQAVYDTGIASTVQITRVP